MPATTTTPKKTARGQALGWLQNTFDHHLSPEAEGYYLDILEKFKLDVVGDAMEALVNTLLGKVKIPSPNQVLEYLGNIQYQKNREQIDKEGTKRTIPAVWGSEVNRGFIEDLGGCMTKKLNRKAEYPLEQYADDLKRLDEKYPYLGLDIAAAANRMYAAEKIDYEEQGYVLKVWKEKGKEAAKRLLKLQWQHPDYISRLLEERLRRWQKKKWGKPFAP